MIEYFLGTLHYILSSCHHVIKSNQIKSNQIKSNRITLYCIISYLSTSYSYSIVLSLYYHSLPPHLDIIYIGCVHLLIYYILSNSILSHLSCNLDLPFPSNHSYHTVNASICITINNIQTQTTHINGQFDLFSSFHNSYCFLTLLCFASLLLLPFVHFFCLFGIYVYKYVYK